MAAVHHRRGNIMFPPITHERTKAVTVKHKAHQVNGKSLLRRPRQPAVQHLQPDPVEPPDSPEPTKSIVSEISRINSYTGLYRYSPEPSVHPSVVSPPPPSELQSNHNYPRRIIPSNYILKNDTRYVLDPLFRDKTNVGTYVEGRGLVKAYRTRGPPHLMPVNPPKTNPAMCFNPLPLCDEYDMERYCEPPDFSLQDFLIKVSQVQRLPLNQVKQVMFSRHNYKKIQKILAEELVPKKIEVSVTEMRPSDEMPHVSPRVPQRQLLLEMATLVKEQMSETMNTQMKSVIRALPKYSPHHPIGAPVPHTEILLYEDTDDNKQIRELEAQGRDELVYSNRTRIFQGFSRSDSPFAPPDDSVISPAELAVLDSLMSGGTVLSLKANFISSLPDIEPIIYSLTYLNLSFNDFRAFPPEVCQLRQLVVLKLRNNPLQVIPDEISNLQRLRVLVLSFCLLSELPTGLFALGMLEHLDLAYNRVETIPNDIRNCINLKEMNVEGNQLIGMPMGMLKLRNLNRLKVKNNYMHPTFWYEHSQKEPQKLVDMAALNFSTSGQRPRHHRIPDYVKDILDNPSTCDCCAGPLYGEGIRIIRPASKMFGVKNLPFLFAACSPYCREAFMNSTESLTAMLYGDDYSEDFQGDEQ